MARHVSRRQALARTALTVGGAVVTTLVGALGAPVARAMGGIRVATPNIVVFDAGGWTWQGTGAADAMAARMPTLSRLRREGVTFDHAFIGSATHPFPISDGYRITEGSDPQHLAALLAARDTKAPFLFTFRSAVLRRPFASDGRIDAATVVVPPYLPDTPDVRRDIADYQHALSRFDAEVGQMLAMIERSGKLEDTIVVVTSTRGWSFPRAAETLYDAGNRVPLVARLANRFGAGMVVTRVVNATDLGSTLYASAHSPEPGYVAMQTAAYPAQAVRTADYLYIRNRQPALWPAGAPATGAVTLSALALDSSAAFGAIAASPSKTALVAGRGDPAIDPLLDLATARRPAEELYDVRTDPFQLVNLARDPAMRAVMDRLARTLERRA
jgi:N-sulfoglucosamine sulfohydrolase